MEVKVVYWRQWTVSMCWDPIHQQRYQTTLIWEKNLRFANLDWTALCHHSNGELRWNHTTTAETYSWISTHCLSTLFQDSHPRTPSSYFLQNTDTSPYDDDARKKHMVLEKNIGTLGNKSIKSSRHRQCSPYTTPPAILFSSLARGTHTNIVHLEAEFRLIKIWLRNAKFPQFSHL